MKNNKKYITMFLVAMMICMVTGCSSEEKKTESTITTSEEQNHEKVVASIEEDDTTEDDITIEVDITTEEDSTTEENEQAQIESGAEMIYAKYDELYNSEELNLTPKVGEFLTKNENHEIVENADGKLYGYAEDYWEGCSQWCAVNNYEGNAVASSFLSPQGSNTYEADNIISHNRENAWVEGVEGDGVGEYISISKRYERGGNYGEWDCFFFPDLCIVNGMAKNEQAWKANNRVKKLKMYFNDEYICDLELLDTMKPQYISLSGLHLSANNGENSVFKFEIADVYKGDKYDDTVITGIEIELGTWAH